MRRGESIPNNSITGLLVGWLWQLATGFVVHGLQPFGFSVFAGHLHRQMLEPAVGGGPVPVRIFAIR